MISSLVLTGHLLRKACCCMGGKLSPPPWGLVTSLIWYQCWPRKGSVRTGKPERKVFLLTGQTFGIRFWEVIGSSSQWRKCATSGVKNVTLQTTAGRKLPAGLHLLGNVILGHTAMKDSSSLWVRWGRARFSLLLLPGGLGRNHAEVGSSDLSSCQVCPSKSQGVWAQVNERSPLTKPSWVWNHPGTWRPTRALPFKTALSLWMVAVQVRSSTFRTKNARARLS